MLTQGDADALLAMPKKVADKAPLEALHGTRYTREVESVDGTEKFVLDVDRKSIRLSKCKYQMRGRKVVILARLDIAGSPHTNPRALGGAEMGGTHLHVYREGYGDKFAIEVDPETFTDTTDAALTLAQFCAYLNVKEPETQMILQLADN